MIKKILLLILLINIFKLIRTYYFNYKYATKIIKNLWIGNRISSCDESFLKNNNIHLIINCSKNIPFTKLEYIKKYRISVNDNLSKETHEEILKRIPEVIRLINYYLKNNKGVLIHCYAGMQRAPTVASCYLMNRLNLNLEEVIKLIKSKRKIAFIPKINYLNTLKTHYINNIN